VPAIVFDHDGAVMDATFRCLWLYADSSLSRVAMTRLVKLAVAGSFYRVRI
jgi:hypothetical protein